MPHETSWYLENHIIFVRMWGDLNAEELKAWNEEIRDFVSSSTAEKIHIMVDDSQLGKVAPNFNEIANALSVVRHPKMGWNFTIGPGNPIFNFFGSIVSRVGNIRHKRLKTVEEAVEVLANENPALAEALRLTREQ